VRKVFKQKWEMNGLENNKLVALLNFVFIRIMLTADLEKINSSAVIIS